MDYHKKYKKYKNKYLHTKDDLYGGKKKLKDPLSHDTWITAKGHDSIKFKPNIIEKRTKEFMHIFGGDISGNVVQFGGGSGVGLWSMILSKMSDKLTVVDYSPAMVKNIKKTFELNSFLLDNVSIVEQRMEEYSDLQDADYIIFTYTMSFADIKETIKNLDKNCKMGCKIRIAETMKSIILTMRTDLSQEVLEKQKKWKTNLLKIEKLFDKNKNWKKEKKVIGGSKYHSIPDLILHYTKVK